MVLRNGFTLTVKMNAVLNFSCKEFENPKVSFPRTIDGNSVILKFSIKLLTKNATVHYFAVTLMWPPVSANAFKAILIFCNWPLYG